MKKVGRRLPRGLKDEYNVAADGWVIWTSLFTMGRYLTFLNKRRSPLCGYILDGKKKVWFVRYGFFSYGDVWQ